MAPGWSCSLMRLIEVDEKEEQVCNSMHPLYFLLKKNGNVCDWNQGVTLLMSTVFYLGAHLIGK